MLNVFEKTTPIFFLKIEQVHRSEEENMSYEFFFFQTIFVEYKYKS